MHRLTDWLTDWLSDWLLTDWLTDWLTLTNPWLLKYQFATRQCYRFLNLTLSIHRYSLLETTMESCKMLLAAISVITLSSVARTAPVNSPPNRVEILIGLGLSPKLTSGTKEVSNAITFHEEFYSCGSERAVNILLAFHLNVETFVLSTLFLQMKSVYQFIASNTDLQNTMLFLGTVITQTCSVKLVCNFS